MTLHRSVPSRPPLPREFPAGRRTILAWLLAAASVAGGGCLRIQSPPAGLAANEVPVRAEFAAAAGDPARVGRVADAWVALFDDHTLIPLVDEALQYNPDLWAAAARRAEAEARIDEAAALLRPRLDAFSDVLRTDLGPGPAANRYDLGVQVSWELDLWGRLRSNREAARQAAAAAGLDYLAVRQSLAASVADAWFLAISANRQLVIDLERLEAELLTARITRDKAEVGAGGQLDLELSDANVALAEDAVRRSRAAIEETSKALEVLLGRYPAAELQAAADLPPLPGATPVGLPSELLERRPDVRAADHRVAAAFHRIESARAARLPRVTLSASLGTLLDPAQRIWSLGPGLLAPLYTGGQLEAQIRIAGAQQVQALAEYARIGLQAFREVEAALANERYLGERVAQLEVADTRLRNASRIAENRYDAGVISILDLIQVRRQDFETRSLLLQVHTERLRQRINLYLALGGPPDESQAARPDRETARDADPAAQETQP